MAPTPILERSHRPDAEQAQFASAKRKNGNYISMSRGKRRSKSQLLGEIGEAIFRQWALKRQLSPNKTEQDYGIDFFCQSLNPIFANGAIEEASGTTIAALVRTCSGVGDGSSKPRVKITTNDAMDMLRQRQPVFFFGINESASTVHFRLLDENFATELSNFVTSNKKNLWLRLDTMSTDESEFSRLRTKVQRAGFQHRLEIVKAKLALRRTGTQAKLTYRQDEDCDLALVQIPRLGSAYRFTHENETKARALAFEEMKPPHEIEGVTLKEEVITALDLASDLQILMGENPSNVRVTISSKEDTSELEFRVRNINDEWALVHDIGLSLVFSERRFDRKAKQHYHSLEGRLFKGRLPLGSCPDALAFLRLMMPDAKLTGRGEMPISSFGSHLESIGPAVRALEQVSKAIGVDLSRYFLDDLKNSEFGLTTAFLENLLCRDLPLDWAIPGFVVGDYKLEDLKLTPAEMRLPVVANLGEVAVVAWVEILGQVCLNPDDQICGLRFDEQTGTQVETRPRLMKSKFPEIWLHAQFPPVHIEPAPNRTDVLTYNWPDYEVTIECEIYAPEPV